jgi:hypothetical protein
MKLTFIILCYSNTTAVVKHFKILKTMYRASDTIQTLFELHNLATLAPLSFVHTHKYDSPLSCNLADDSLKLILYNPQHFSFLCK